MALINCPECSKQVSDMAEKCPDCGFSVGVLVANMVKKPRAITVEQTGKNWKTAKLAAVGLVAGGCVIAIAGLPSVGALMLFAGLAAAVYAGIGAWWNHS